MENEMILIQKAKKDPEAFGVIYDFYYPKIFRFIYGRVGSREVAEDVAAETFFQALKNLWRYRFMRRPFSAWLYKIASTQVAQFYRSDKRHRSLAFEECPELLHLMSRKRARELSPEHALDRRTEWYRVRQAMRRLKEVEQNVLVLRYMEQKSLVEISECTGLKNNTVKSHLRRGLKHLRNQYFIILSDYERRQPQDAPARTGD